MKICRENPHLISVTLCVPHIDWPGVETGTQPWEAGDWLPGQWHGLSTVQASLWTAAECYSLWRVGGEVHARQCHVILHVFPVTFWKRVCHSREKEIKHFHFIMHGHGSFHSLRYYCRDATKEVTPDEVITRTLLMSSVKLHKFLNLYSWCNSGTFHIGDCP